MDKREEFKIMIDKYHGESGALIPVLQETQEIYGYLTKDSLEYISNVLKIPFSEVYGVATFYSQFRLKPIGENLIKVCSGTACHVRGGDNVLEQIEQELGIKSGNTTEDFKFSIEKVACIGACGLAPVMMINDETYGRLNKDKIKSILSKYR